MSHLPTLEVREMEEKFNQWIEGIKTHFTKNVSYMDNFASNQMVANIKLENGQTLKVGKFDFEKENGEIYDRRTQQMVVPVDRRGWE